MKVLWSRFCPFLKNFRCYESHMKVLRKCYRNYSHRLTPNARISSYSSVVRCSFAAASSLVASSSSIQVAFLDIDMPEINGLDVAKVLHQRYPEMILVFVTSFIKYAPSGYKVNAFRYLLKTQLDEELSDCMDDLQEKLYDNNRTIQIRQRDRILPLAIKNILYFEGTSQRRVQVFLLNGETIECLGKLEDYDNFLSDQGFIRLQKSFLVNMHYIDKIASYSAQLRNSTTIRVSEKNYKEICRKFLLWKGTNL